MGTLYLVATPIGNMEDITLRAIKTLGSVDILLCEDTRHTGLLLQWITERIRNSELIIKNFNFTKPQLLSYQEFNELRRIPEVIALLKEGKNVALVSDAGTPTISDPGYKLVRECIKENITVQSIPGPSAILSALVSSGLATDKFLFLGYLPLKQSKRQKLWDTVNTTHCSVVFTTIIYEAPHRLLKTLNEIKERFGNIEDPERSRRIEIVVCRELTKIHEEIFRGKVDEAIEYFSMKPIKGEITLLLHSSPHNSRVH